MPDLDDLFRGGPPSKAELERWLRNETDARPSEIAGIVERYNPAEARGLTPENLRAYLETQWGVYEGERRPTFEQEVERVHRQGREEPEHESAAERARVAGAEAARREAANIPSWLQDVGPSVDPEALGTSIAIGVFTDRDGRPRVDEAGNTIPVNAQTLWEEIRGTRFDMGSLALRTKAPLPSDEREGAARVARQIARRRFLTPSGVMAMLGGLDEDYLIGLQQQLWEAGLFGEDLPSWGVVDEATRRAVMGLFGEASLTPDEPVDRVIARLVDEQVRRRALGGEGEAGAEAPVFQPEVTSAETLGQMIDDIAQDLVGSFLPEDRRSALVAQLQQREIETQRQAFGQDVAAQGGAAGDIDAFMAAISGQESGGDYDVTNPQSGAYGRFQIMPANWGPWAEQAGLGRNAPRTPQNQDYVARFMMNRYYQSFGNWRDVAIAWYAGPGRVSAARGALDRPQGRYPSINRYADQVMERFAALRGQGPPPGTPGEMPPITRFDAAAEAEAIIRAQDPAGWEAHQYAQRATEFYSLLQGVVGG